MSSPWSGVCSFPCAPLSMPACAFPRAGFISQLQAPKGSCFGRESWFVFNDGGDILVPAASERAEKWHPWISSLHCKATKNSLERDTERERTEHVLLEMRVRDSKWLLWILEPGNGNWVLLFRILIMSALLQLFHCKMLPSGRRSYRFYAFRILRYSALAHNWITVLYTTTFCFTGCPAPSCYWFFLSNTHFSHQISSPGIGLE